MPESDYILALCIGTTSVKAVVFDCAGGVIAKGVQEYDLEKPSPGVVGLDPQVYWSSAVSAIASACSRSLSAGKNIRAVGVTSQAGLHHGSQERLWPRLSLQLPPVQGAGTVQPG